MNNLLENSQAESYYKAVLLVQRSLFYLEKKSKPLYLEKGRAEVENSLT